METFLMSISISSMNAGHGTVLCGEPEGAVKSVEELENPQLSGEDGGCRFVLHGVEK